MSENRRKSELGRFGETVVCERLAQNGYSCTRLGGTNRCFDIEAHKDGQKFLFSVKTRNHTTYSGDIKKDYYNLFFSRKPGDPYAVVNAAFEIARGQSATPSGPPLGLIPRARDSTFITAALLICRTKDTFPWAPATGSNT
jgi:hypothetical protein